MNHTNQTSISIHDGTGTTPNSVEQLWDEAARYGLVSVFASDRDEHPNRYRVTITFQTRKYTEMKAQSRFGVSLATGLIEAIANAQSMVNTVRRIGVDD